MKTPRRFANVALAGITFQAGSTAVDSATIMSALIYQLTGNPLVVGAVTAILRFGWLFPQLFIGFLAQKSGTSMQYYVIGAFGRAICMALLGVLLMAGANWDPLVLAIPVMLLWTAYAFISGIVAVPYNDIVARAVPSNLRSRLLATRFFGGGLLALGVVAISDRLVGSLPFPTSYAAIILMASALMLASSSVFTAMGEPETPGNRAARPGFFSYLSRGIDVFRTDHTFRRFVLAQWCGGAVLMAMPFYVVFASAAGFDLDHVALLLGAQTFGALLSNPLWGWWGDRLGKVRLLKAIALGRIFPPLAVLVLSVAPPLVGADTFRVFVAMFFLIGALANGLTIAVIGFLMEISPDDQRPAYSGYFNAITAPAFLLPLLGGLIASTLGLTSVFAISLIAAAAQFLILRTTNVPARAPARHP